MRTGLNQEQVALVLRRATELDHDLDTRTAVPSLDPAAVEEAAVEAGITRAAVRQALAELDSGLLANESGGSRRHGARGHNGHGTPNASRHGGLLGPAVYTVTRAVPGPIERVERHLGWFLRDQLFEMRRFQGARTTWVRRRGIEATARRAIDRALQHRLVLREVHHVDVSLHDRDDGWVVVRLDVDVLAIRHRQGTLAGGATVAGGGVATMTAVLAPMRPAFLLIGTVGASTAGLGMWAGRNVYRKRVGAIELGVGGMLDQLEHRVPAR